jgi:hypothetical protein
MQFQGTTAPDGMIVGIFGPIVGARHDIHVNRVSQINRRLRDCQVGNPIQYISYKDKAYVNESHGIAAHRGVNLTYDQRKENYIMSKVRIVVEWGFGKVVNTVGYVHHWQTQRIRTSAVGKEYFAAVLLTNCNTCLYGSQSALHFGIVPPTLGEYFNKPNVRV